MIPGGGPLPWLLPGIAVALAVSVAASGNVGRALWTRRVVAWVMLLTLGIILSATMTPLRGAFESGSRASAACDLSRLGLPSLEELFRGDVLLNILMFVPLGVAVALLPHSRRRTLVLLAVIALPFAIETYQLLLPALDRACESADVVDNLTGLAIGLAAGLVAGRLLPGIGQAEGSLTGRAERDRPRGEAPGSRP